MPAQDLEHYYNRELRIGAVIMLWFGITPCCELVDHGPPLGPYAIQIVYCYVV